VGAIFFRTCTDRPWGSPSLLYNEYRVFPRGKEQPGRDAKPSPTSNAVVMEEESYTSTLPLGGTACTEPQCLYKGDLYLYSDLDSKSINIVGNVIIRKNPINETFSNFIC